MEKSPDWLTIAADELEEGARPKVAKASALALRLSQDLRERTRDFLSDMASPIAPRLPTASPDAYVTYFVAQRK